MLHSRLSLLCFRFSCLLHTLLLLLFAFCVHFFLAIACADSIALAAVVAQTAYAEAAVATHVAIVAAFAIPPDDVACFVSAADAVTICVHC